MSRFIFWIFFSIGLLSIIGVHLVWGQSAEKASKKIKRFAQVDKNLYRGGQPDKDDLKLLKEMGIKKIINFRYEDDLIEKEKRRAEALGLEYVSIPWAIFAAYDHDVFQKFFTEIQNRDEKPVFFHCKRGSERTGVAAAAYKIKHKDMSVEKAYEQAKDFDIHFYWKPFVYHAIKQFYKHTHEKEK